jgi:hypothetical protein
MSRPEAYLKTSALASARTPSGLPYKGQKALVITALLRSGKPLTAEEILSKMRALWKGTASAVPPRANKDAGFSP